jgi:phage RecT family recombinase
MPKKTNHNRHVDDYVAELSERIESVLPADKAPATFLAVTTEYLLRHPDLFRAERRSLDQAIVDAAMLGLELGAPFDLATIIPYKDREGRIFANLIVEYRGHMVQVYRTGKIRSIEARPVYEADRFEFEFGRRPLLAHQPAIVGARGALVYAYAIAQLSDGGSAMEVITKHDADKARGDSPTADRPGSLWRKRPAEMWTKTAIKKLVARLPRTAKGGGTTTGTDPPREYADLVNAVCVSPDLYRSALNDLEIAFPADVVSIRAVLAYMRKLYRSQQQQNGTPDPSRKQQKTVLG